MLMPLLLLVDSAASPSPTLPAFMSGCWEQQAGESWTEECWTSSRGGLMIGSGRTGTANEVRQWEWMRIERGADGTLTFYGSPGGTTPVGFKASEVSATSVTFVNSGHDYPQRIRYVLNGNRLDAEVSLADGSKANRWQYLRPGTPK